MNFIQEPRVSLQTNFMRYAIVGAVLLSAIIGAVLFLGGMGASSDSEAATVTVSSSTSVNSGNNPFGSLGTGDTMMINGSFNVNADYTVHANNAITVIVDGSNAKLKVFKNRKLVLGAGSSIVLLNGGSLESTGNCQSSAEIYFGSVLVANCPGSSTVFSFANINSAGIISGVGSLPVSWLKVDARVYSEGQVQVRWSTASEENNNRFIVEYSEDGESWLEGPNVDSKAVNGNSVETLDYQEMHYPPAYLSKIYYRIKQIDFDGKFDYSDVVQLKLTQKDKVVVSTLGESKIKLNVSSEASSQTLRIFSQEGTLLVNGQVEANKVLTLPKPGLYIIEVGEGEERQRIKHMVL